MEKQYFKQNYNDIRERYVRTEYAFVNSENNVLKLNDIIQKYGVESLIDYGCGEALSTKNLSIPVFNYDPFVEQFKQYPETPADMVICYNSLNWIEDYFFDDVINDLHSLTKKVLICNIRLPGHYNRQLEYYRSKLESKFSIVDCSKIHTLKKNFMITKKIETNLKQSEVYFECVKTQI